MEKFDPAVITILLSCIGVLLTYLAFFKTANNDSKTDGKADGQISSDLGYVKKGIEDINHKLEKQDERYIALSNQVAKIDASTRQAHKRLDDFIGARRPDDKTED